MRCSRIASLTLISATLWLAGCSTTSHVAREPTPVTSNPSSAPASSAAPLPRRGGGYYLDDGPGEHPPANLDRIPDAVPRVERYASGANRPYNVFGVDYVPDLSEKPFKQRGIASWYGRKFHGQRTSSGEIYDMYGMTAAHPTLPIPSYARVTNLANGRSVIVRINDRGPFHPGRVIDLSFSAAYRLGYANVGSINVELERILPKDIAAGRIPSTTGPTPIPLAPANQSAAPVIVALAPRVAAAPVEAAAEPTPILAPTPLAPVANDSARAAMLLAELPPDLVPDDLKNDVVQNPAPAPTGSVLVKQLAPVAGGFFVQVGAFGSRRAAEDFRTHLAGEIDAELALQLRINEGTSVYRVQLGPYVDRAGADGAAHRLHDDLDVNAMIVTPTSCSRTLTGAC